MKYINIGVTRTAKIKVDDDIFEIYKNEKFYIVHDQAVVVIDGKKKNLTNLIMGINGGGGDKNIVRFKKDIGIDFTRNNLYLESKTERNYKRGPEIYGKEFKGTHLWRGYHSACAYHKGIKFQVATKSEIESARKYNAMCDYFNNDGYRNDVPKIRLTASEKEYIKNRWRKMR